MSVIEIVFLTFVISSLTGFDRVYVCQLWYYQWYEPYLYSCCVFYFYSLCFVDYAAASARQYQTLTKQIKPDLDRYNEAKEKQWVPHKRAIVMVFSCCFGAMGVFFKIGVVASISSGRLVHLRVQKSACRVSSCKIRHSTVSHTEWQFDWHFVPHFGDVIRSAHK